MKPRTTKAIYWTIISLFCLFTLFDGIGSVLRTDASKQIFLQLGYPIYTLTIIGIAKLLGAIALLQNKYPTLKEWAYAGFIIDLLGASASWAFTTHAIGDILFPLFIIALLLWSRSIWKKSQSSGVRA